MLTRFVAIFLAGILMITSNMTVGFAAPALSQEDKTMSRLRTEAAKFTGGVERVRVWTRDNVDFAGWINQVETDRFEFTDEASLQEKFMDLRQVEKIAQEGHNQPLHRWTWEQLPKTMEGRPVMVTTQNGLRLEGVVLGISPTEMILDVKKTSDKQLQSKGNAVLAKGFITSIRLKEKHLKGRRVGLVTGAGLGGLAAFTSMINTENSPAATGGEAAAIFAVTVGVFYLVGWLADRASHKNEAVILIIPS